MKYLFKKDITHLYVASGDDLKGLSPSGDHYARLLDADEIRQYSANPIYDISATAAGVVDGKSQFCCATFIGDTLTAYAFFALGNIDAIFNSAGTGFGGIGLRLPPNAMYVYKVFVLPEYRGRNQMVATLQHGASELLPSHGWAITTTDIGNFPAQGMFKKLGFAQHSRLSEYRLFGIGYYDMPRTFQLGTQSQSDAGTVKFIAGRRHC